MSKFKVGDRVRRVKHSGVVHNCPIGHEATVGTPTAVGFWYTGADGSQQNTTSPGDWELISTGPVRTVTRKEIVPGVYGRVKVAPEGFSEQWKDVGIGVRFVMRSDATETSNAALSASELRAAAATFIELADALEEV